MKMKKINAALGLLSIVAMLVHIGYTVFAYLTFYYNESLKILTAIPFMVLVCLHAVCGMLTVFLQADGTRLDLYPKQNLRTILQRASAALILPLMILHINTYGLLASTAEAEQWLWFALLMLSQPLFYGVALTHVAVSVTRGLITLGLLSSSDRQKRIDRVIYVLGALAFAVATFVVLQSPFPVMYMRDMLAKTMQKHLGIVRSEDNLAQGLNDIDYDLSIAERIHYDSSVMPYFNYSLTAILTLARATVTCALERRESRGAHYRSDFPKTDEALGFATIIAYHGGKYSVRLDKERAYES